jgi:alkylated DNA nucleotide flippase Atl1
MRLHDNAARGHPCVLHGMPASGTETSFISITSKHHIQVKAKKPYLVMYIVATLEVEEPTEATSSGIDETAPMTGSKRAASASGDKMPKMPKMLLTSEEKVVQATRRWDRCAGLKLKQRQQLAEQAMRVSAMLPLQMKANTNAQVRLPPAMDEAMFFMKQERIIVNAPPAP